MWYAVQVRTGEEEKTKLLCSKLISREILSECFVPYYERKKKYEGSWHKTERILFPGYIFMVSDLTDDLRVKVKKVPSMIKILGDGNEIIPLNEKEIAFLMKFQDEDHRIKMSTGFIENEQIMIADGPMKDFTGIIKRIDRHKKIAVIEMEFFGRTMDIQVGMEILNKV